MKQKIAIVGTGIAGLCAAHLLKDRHELTLFEANDYIGGHTHTVDVEDEAQSHAIDTGFIVFNDRTYPNFIRLLDRLGVASRPTTMSFSVRSDTRKLEYNGHDLNGLFAQRRNLFSPRFLGMLRDILRFNREAPGVLDGPDPARTLGDYLQREGYGSAFLEDYLVPMAAAIWSNKPGDVRRMELRFFVRFFVNHGLLQVKDRPQWRVVEGGSRQYVRAIVQPFRDRIRLSCPVRSITRDESGVTLRVQGAEPERFDAVVLAVHSDQALRMIDTPTDAEREILGAIPYQPNDVALHRDTRFLPRRRRAWAAWNYLLDNDAQDRPAALTYDMNILQGIVAEPHFCVNLNRNEAIDPDRLHQTFVYEHPIFDSAGVRAQTRHDEINGHNRTYYCGAYWGYGFHEDGVRSAIAAVRPLGGEEL